VSRGSGHAPLTFMTCLHMILVQSAENCAQSSLDKERDDVAGLQNEMRDRQDSDTDFLYDADLGALARRWGLDAIPTSTQSLSTLAI
jgi:hypothetical protein